MITPTGGVTIANYLSAIRNGAQTAVRLHFTEQNVTLGPSDIDSEGGIQILDIMNPDVDLIFGKAVAKELTVTLNRSSVTDRLRWTSEFTVEAGVMINNTMQYVTLGYFHGKRPEKTLGQDINFVAHDRMTNFDILADEFISNITTFPVSLQDIYDDLCTYVGVSNVSGDEISTIMQREFDSLPFQATGVTCRDVLAWIAEAVGCYARITPAGYVKMCWFGDHTSDLDIPLQGCFDMDVSEIAWLYDESLRKKWQDIESDKWQELETVTWRGLEGEYSPFCVDAIRMIMTEDDIGVSVPSTGTAHNLYTIVDNPFLYGADTTETAGYLTLLLNRVKGLGIYYPTKAVTIGNWLIEAGDIVTVEYAPDEFRSFPVFNTGFFWNGGHESTFESTGNLERENVSLTNAQKLSLGGKFHIFRNNVNELYSQIGDRTGKSTTLTQDVDHVEIVAEGKATIYYSGTEPSEKETGDFWMDTANGNVMKRWNGSAWVTVDDQTKYTVRSGIDIVAAGVEVTGGKYVKIVSGGVFDVDSTNFKLSSADKKMTTGNVEYGENGLVVKKVAYDDTVSAMVLGSPPDQTFTYDDIVQLIKYGCISTTNGYLELKIIPNVNPLGNDCNLTLTYSENSGGHYIDAKILPNARSNWDDAHWSLGGSGNRFYRGYFDAVDAEQFIGNADSASKIKNISYKTGGAKIWLPSSSYHLMLFGASSAASSWIGFVLCDSYGTVTTLPINSSFGSGVTITTGTNWLQAAVSSGTWTATLMVCMGGNAAEDYTAHNAS